MAVDVDDRALPTGLAYAAQGAVLPALVVSAQQLGASAATAAAVVALLGAGQLAGSVPAGVLAARFGDRVVLVVASLVIALCWSTAYVVKTLGADAAPRDSRAAFLGLWVLITDLGSSGGPLLAAALTAASSLAAATTVLAFVTLVGAASLAHLLRERDDAPGR